MENFLITGGAGFLGSHLCEALSKMGHKVTAVDMADGEKIEHLMKLKNFRFIQDSVLDKSLMNREIEKCDIILHLAAIADPIRYVEEPLTVLRIDLEATQSILEMVSQSKVKFVFASTSEIYGKNANVPWKENDDRLLGPTHINRWCYSTAKAVIEHYCYAYAQQEELKFLLLRFFNVYGPRLDDLGHGRVIPMFLKQFLTNQPVYVHGDGKQTRTFLYVDDAVKGIIKAVFCKKAENQIFNIGSTKEINMLDLALLIKKIGNFSSPIKFIPHKEIFGESYEDIPRRVPDISKIKKIVGWESIIDNKEGLKRTIAYYRKRRRL